MQCKSPFLFELFLCVAAGSAVWLVLRRQHRKEIDEWTRKRQEERRGRIRAEVKLRTALKEQNSTIAASRNGEMDDSTLTFPLKRIGTIVSPYTKRMGTPRQPGLVPASKGRIDLDDGVQSALLDGIEEYSHIWVIFQFHANTDTNQSQKTKIRPPRGNGIKVGQLATRSPHRPNPIGLSMVRLDKREPRRLLISGLDLVHSTPVYDIKPVVPWDMVPDVLLRVPNWVSTDNDILPQVAFTDKAMCQLHDAVDNGLFGDLYSRSIDGLNSVRDTIQQILQQDPRSSHRGLKSNARGSRQEGNSDYHLTLGQTRVTFQVCQSIVRVMEVTEQTFAEEQYVDGVPLLSESPS